MTLALGGISLMTQTQSKMNECEGKPQKNRSSYAMETGQQKLKHKSSTKKMSKRGWRHHTYQLRAPTPLPADSHMAGKKNRCNSSSKEFDVLFWPP